MVEDVQRWQIAKLMGVKPWEVDDLPEYWINRAIWFENAINEAQAHRATQPK